MHPPLEKKYKYLVSTTFNCCNTVCRLMLLNAKHKIKQTDLLLAKLKMLKKINNFQYASKSTEKNANFMIFNILKFLSLGQILKAHSRCNYKPCKRIVEVSSTCILNICKERTTIRLGLLSNLFLLKKLIYMY